MKYSLSGTSIIEAIIVLLVVVTQILEILIGLFLLQIMKIAGTF